MPILTTDAELRDLLARCRSIAVVGCSNRPTRPSYGVAAYLQAQGYTIHPVNPLLAGTEILGRHVYASLAELPTPPDLVDVFRRSEYLPALVEEALACGARALWTQLGVRDDAAAARASAAGLLVVQDRCTQIEHRRLGIGRV